MHGEVYPIYEDPVVGLSLSHALVVGTAQAVVHQRHHAWPHLADESCIACVLIVVEHRLEPVERVVHDGVDVGRHGVLAAQLADGALDAFRVEAQVVVHQIRLDGIARPGPAVALDAVHEELARRQVHRVGSHLPDAVQLVIGAAEGARVREVVWGIFVVHQHVGIGGACLLFYIDIAEGFACCDTVAASRTGEDIEGLAVLAV